MSALTSSMALQLVGRLDEGEAVLHLPLPRGVLREGEARRVAASLVQHDEFLARSPARLSAHGSWPSRSRRRRAGAASATRRRRSGARRRSGPTGRTACRRPCTRAAGSRRSIAADRALDHPAVAADAVVVVDDVVAGLEVLEDRGGLAPAGRGGRWARRRPVRSPSASDGQLGLGQDAAAVERGDHDPAVPGAVEALVEPAPADGGRGRGRARRGCERGWPPTLALCGDHHAVAVGEERAQLVGDRLRVARRRPPSPASRPTGVSGESGVAVSDHAAPATPASSRSAGRWRTGKASTSSAPRCGPACGPGPPPRPARPRPGRAAAWARPGSPGAGPAAGP